MKGEVRQVGGDQAEAEPGKPGEERVSRRRELTVTKAKEKVSWSKLGGKAANAGGQRFWVTSVTKQLS